MKERLFQPRTGGLLLMAAIIVVLPVFLPNRFYYDVAILVGINAIVVVGLNLLIGYAARSVLAMPASLALAPMPRACCRRTTACRHRWRF